MRKPQKALNKRKRSTKRLQAVKAPAANAQPNPVDTREQAVVVERIEFVQGIYSSPAVARKAVEELERAGFSENDITVSSVSAGIVEPEPVTEMAESRNPLAGIAAGALTLAWTTAVAPAIIGLKALSRAAEIVEDNSDVELPVLVQVRVAQETAKRAFHALQRSGGQNVGLSGDYDFSGMDVVEREYRDETGRIHHHTRTYMRDHARELSRAA